VTDRTVVSGREKWSSASLRIIGESLQPAQITAALGIEPTRSGLKGERVSVRNQAVRRTSFWLKTSPLAHELPLQDHLEWLLTLFEPKLDALKAISERHGCNIFCGFASENGQGGASLSSGLIARLAALHVPLEIDLYPPEPIANPD